MDLSISDIVRLITIAINIVTICFLISMTYRSKKMDEQLRKHERFFERIRKSKEKASEDEI